MNWNRRGSHAPHGSTKLELEHITKGMRQLVVALEQAQESIECLRGSVLCRGASALMPPEHQSQFAGCSPFVIALKSTDDK